jgi:pentatricopeptide repeat protein
MERYKIFPPDSYLFNLMIALAVNQRDIHFALRAYNVIIALDIPPTIHSYGKLIEYFGKEGYIDEMEKYYGLMLKHNVKPDSVTYGTMISSYARMGYTQAVCSRYHLCNQL